MIAARRRAPSRGVLERRRRERHCVAMGNPAGTTPVGRERKVPLLMMLTATKAAATAMTKVAATTKVGATMTTATMTMLTGNPLSISAPNYLYVWQQRILLLLLLLLLLLNHG